MEEETKTNEAEPMDLKLQQVMKENLELMNQIKDVAGVLIWIKIFIVYAIMISIFMLFKLYKVV